MAIVTDDQIRRAEFKRPYEEGQISERDKKLFDGMFKLAIDLLRNGDWEELANLHDNGPYDSGHTIHSTMRNRLVIHECCSFGVVKGEQGFSFCTTKGARVLKYIKLIQSCE